MIAYFMALGFAMFAIGVAGIASSRHFLVMVLSAEVMLLAAALLAVTFFYYAAASAVVPLLIVLWSVAAVETIALVVIYKSITGWDLGTDVTKLSRLRH